MTRAHALRLLRSKAFLRQCVRDGMSAREIAAVLGVQRSTVRERMRFHDIAPVRRPRPSPPGSVGRAA